MPRTWHLLILLALSTALTARSQNDSPVLVTVELSKPSASTFFDRLRDMSRQVFYKSQALPEIGILPMLQDTQPPHRLTASV